MLVVLEGFLVKLWKIFITEKLLVLFMTFATQLEIEADLIVILNLKKIY